MSFQSCFSSCRLSTACPTSGSLGAASLFFCFLSFFFLALDLSSETPTCAAYSWDLTAGLSSLENQTGCYSRHCLPPSPLELHVLQLEPASVLRRQISGQPSFCLSDGTSSSMWGQPEPHCFESRLEQPKRHATVSHRSKSKALLVALLAWEFVALQRPVM